MLCHSASCTLLNGINNTYVCMVASWSWSFSFQTLPSWCFNTILFTIYILLWSLMVRVAVETTVKSTALSPDVRERLSISSVSTIVSAVVIIVTVWLVVAALKVRAINRVVYSLPATGRGDSRHTPQTNVYFSTIQLAKLPLTLQDHSLSSCKAAQFTLTESSKPTSPCIIIIQS